MNHAERRDARSKAASASRGVPLKHSQTITSSSRINMPTIYECLLVTILLCCASFAQVPTQTKAHTVEQCKADASRWAAQPISYKDWSVEVVNSAFKEMLYCDMDYQQDSAHTQFAQLQHRLQDEISARYQHFIDRHGLFNLFLDEDEKGAR
jgi:hypothetical protein